MNTSIRQMADRDIETVLRIIRAHDAFDGECADRDLRGYPGDPARRRSPHEAYFVAVDDDSGEVIGVSGYFTDRYRTPGIFWLGWTYVDERFRRRGAGSALLRHVVQQVREKGARKLYIDTGSAPSYQAAVALYQRFGFAVEGQLKDYYGDGEDFLILGRRI
ncbi:MAG: GNAT family N-acetyltransferase [Armatimonadetes bacterium]|nr:GNAT family N-acetyltransferase [Armatimonadota bacterium]